MADAISPISTSAGSECQTVDVARMSVAGEIEQLFEDGEVQSPMSASDKAGEQLDGPLLGRPETVARRRLPSIFTLPSKLERPPKAPPALWTVARPKIRFPRFSVCISVRSERSSGTGFHPHNEGIW
jgi:hypothetical protein